MLFSKLSFSVSAGTLLHVHGPNGSGKTTLLRALCGMGLPLEGQVSWDGRPIREAGEDYRRELLYIGHLNGLKDTLTGEENLRFSANLAGASLDPDQARQALERMGLKACWDLPVKAMSQGQKRRTALARLLVSQARLWILDEPFTALDVAAVGELSGTVSHHVETGGMVILTTHQEVEIQTGKIQHLHLDS